MSRALRSARPPHVPVERSAYGHRDWVPMRPVTVPVMGRRGSTICDRICLVGARGWLLIGGDQVVVRLRGSAATAAINRTVAGAMALSRTRRWDAIAPRK